MTATDVIQAAAAAVNIPLVVLAWGAARKAARHADESAGAAMTIVEVEQRREHRDLFPQVEISCVRKPGHTLFELIVRLKGPDALDHLDRFTVTIRDDGQARTPSAGSDVTQQELDEQIWGPYLLKPYGGGADGFGRASVPRPLAVGEQWSWYLLPTSPPRWVTDPNSWTQQYASEPVRLALTCERDGYEPWILRREIPQPDM